MWPLFSDEWQQWRKTALKLPPVPLSSDSASDIVRQPSSGAASLAAVPPLLYTLSPLVVPRPGYWPERATLTGFWYDDQVPYFATDVFGNLQRVGGGGGYDKFHQNLCQENDSIVSSYGF